MVTRTRHDSPRAIGYRRVSTAEQAGSGLGLDAQQTAIEATAGRLGLPLVAVHDDAGLSGGLALEQRPGLMGALDALRRGDVLVIAKRDRLGRDVLNVALIERLAERRGARIVSAAGEGTEGDGPTAALMRTIVDAFAQYERALIRSRTRAALRAKLGRGERAGNVAFGFAAGADGRLTPNVSEQRTLAEIYRLHAAGLTLRAIADTLNAAGHRTRRGTAWKFQYVARLLDARQLRLDAAA